jgi:hypothetical protein
MHKKKAYQMLPGAADVGEQGALVFRDQAINSGSVRSRN